MFIFCLSPPGNPASRWTSDFWAKSVLLILANLGGFNCFFGVLGSFQTNLLCIVGELAEGGTVAVAVFASDRWQVTLNYSIFFTN